MAATGSERYTTATLCHLPSATPLTLSAIRLCRAVPTENRSLPADVIHSALPPRCVFQRCSAGAVLARIAIAGARPTAPGSVLIHAVMEKARTMTGTFRIAAQEMDAAGEGLRFLASDGVTQVNRISSELARTNTRLSRASDAKID